MIGLVLFWMNALFCILLCMFSPSSSIQVMAVTRKDGTLGIESPRLKINVKKDISKVSISGRATSRRPYFTQGSSQRLPRSAFLNKEIRMKFIQRVYLIFAIQVLATVFLTGSLFKFSKILNFFRRNSQTISLLSILTSLLTNMTLVNSSYIRHTFPINIILLALSTISQAIPVGVFATYFDPMTVCLGSMHTLTIFAVLTVYAWQPNPRWDLSVHGQWLLGALLSTAIAFPVLQQLGLPIKDNIVAAFMAIVFGAYVVHDTQRIVGDVQDDFLGAGNRYDFTIKRNRSELTPDEHILAALLLYEDILGMFLEILKFLGNVRNSKEREIGSKDKYNRGYQF